MNRAIILISFILIAGLSYSQHTGCISGNCINGYGTYVWNNGDRYVGDWTNSNMQGSGTYYFLTGDKYIGQWKEGKFDGYGSYYYNSGKQEVGYWANHIFLGTSNPNKTGCVSGDCDNGYGTYVFETGEKYEGNWVNIKRNGFGTNYWVTGDWYRGEWKEDFRDGEGTYQYNNGDKYVGQWKNNKQEGEGTFFYKDGTIEKGFWSAGKFLGNQNLNTTGCISGNCIDGYGTYVYEGGGKYVGNFVNGFREGYGSYDWPGGDSYKGGWKAGSLDGKGMYFYANGEKYDGEWKDHKINGYGTFTYNDGTSKTGMWENGKYVGTGTNNYGCISGDCDNGYGVYTWDSGEKYVGEWKNKKRNGQGTNYWANGLIHEGEWKDDLQHGYGKKSTSSGEVTIGFWENGKYLGENIAKSGCVSGNCQSGFGTFIEQNGNKYVGLFKNGIYEGQGTYTFAEGHEYIGEFKNGKFHGQGNYTIAGTGEKYVGGFANGTYNGIGTFYYQDGRTQSGLWKDGKYAGSTQKDLDPPKVSWLTPTYASSETDKSETKVKLCISSKEELQNVQIFVDGELQVNNAVRGFNVVSSNCDYTLERSVKLKPGDNNVKVIVENGAGKAESSIRTIKYNATSSTNQKRYALVIGNSDYISAPLKNPVNDAKDVAAELKNLGFDVMVYTDVKQNEMKEYIRSFGNKLNANKGVGLFFYAGHGMQVNGENYLIPVNAKIEKEQDVELESVNLKRLMGEMEYAQNELNIVILDACRNNPFARSFRSGGNQGLASTLAPTGTFIAYATAPGNVASDGSGKNGLYTEQLLQALKKPGLRIEDVFKEVRKNVYEKSQKKQVPWENSSIFGDFYFTK
ncbi:MAG: caspase family protein [Bacteroidales bacterium]|nr:caspase family protein [Bacteroidales bacterium]